MVLFGRSEDGNDALGVGGVPVVFPNVRRPLFDTLNSETG